jgi:ABC-type branched-subunit amino acid transport system permease subunit
MQAITVTLDFTGGLDGLRGFAPIKIIKYQFTGDWIPYYAIIAVAVLSLLLTFTIVNSSFGRALAALRNDPNRMEALGYNVPFLKLIIFIIACGIAGLAGLLYVPIGHISPEILGLVFSTNALVWVCIGGRGTLIGGFVGALVVSYFQYFLGSKLQNLWFLLIGLFFIIIVLFKSEGIMGFLKRSKY